MRILCVALLILTPAMAVDWTDWRGPNRDGVSPEESLPESWSPDGENLLWKAPYPGRSAPIVV
ncbi:MAG: serine/threonine protein kinase, partial [bacterium]|nr:serine/threonine protein kinase [bacterium]